MHKLTTVAFSTLIALSSTPSLAQQAPKSAESNEKIEEQVKVLQKRLEELEKELKQQRQDERTRRKQNDFSSLVKKSTENRYNPGIGLIVTGTFSTYDPAEHESAPVGFIMPEESGLPEAGFSVGESELNITGNVDDKFYATATIAFGEEGAEVEEGYLQTLAMPGDLTLKFGRFLSGLGYLNGRHRHTDDFVQRPLVYDAFWGGGHKEDGVALVWLAPTEQFWEIGLELSRGENFAAVGAGHRGIGSKALYSHWGGDVGVSHSWRFGLSWFDGVVDAREDIQTGALFAGDNQIVGIDFIWKWAPNGNPTHRNAKIQVEWFQRKRSGMFVDGGMPVDAQLKDTGGYIQGVYQFTRGWRVGARYAFLSPDSVPNTLQGSFFDSLGHTPERISLMLDWSNSEYSRIRLQYTLDNSTPEDGNVLMLQYTMAFGAHPAHSF